MTLSWTLQCSFISVIFKMIFMFYMMLSWTLQRSFFSICLLYLILLIAIFYFIIYDASLTFHILLFLYYSLFSLIGSKFLYLIPSCNLFYKILTSQLYKFWSPHSIFYTTLSVLHFLVFLYLPSFFMWMIHVNIVFFLLNFLHLSF